MLLVVERASLAQALTDVLPFVPQKSPIAALKNVKITSVGRKMCLAANNPQSSICKFIPIEESSEDVSFLVDAQSFTKYVARVKSDTVKLEVNSENVVVRHSKGKAEFPILPVNEYPEPDFCADEFTEVTMQSALLSTFVNVAKNFISEDVLRPQLMHIYAYIKENIFGVCATDTRQLFTESVDFVNSDNLDINWLIDRALLSSIVKSAKTNDTVNIKIGKKSIAYVFEDALLQSVKVNGKFPDFNRVIPKNHTINCVIDQAEVLDSISRVSLSCGNMSCMKMNISNMDVTLSANDLGQLRSASETVTHNGCNGEITIGVHADYFSNCVGVCDGGEVELRMTDASRPIVLFQSSHPTRSVLLMPMSIQ